MQLGINIRDDFAKLSDAELAERLDKAWGRYHAADKRMAREISPQGPIKRPRLYRCWATLSGSPGFRFIGWVFKAFAVNPNAVDDPVMTKRYVVSDHAVEMDDELTEVQTIMDEIKRRVGTRKGTQS